VPSLYSVSPLIRILVVQLVPLVVKSTDRYRPRRRMYQMLSLPDRTKMLVGANAAPLMPLTTSLS